MWNTLAAPMRWAAICALWLLVALALPLSWLMQLAGGGGLAVAEWARDRIDDLSPHPPNGR